MNLEKEMIRSLIETASAQRSRSYAPYSRYRVGAALLAQDGTVYTGCNIENAAYTPSICAERTAFSKAVSEGETHFDAICVVGGDENEKIPSGFSTPCGVCRQVMREFCEDDFQIHMVTKEGWETATLAEILPFSFSAKKHMV